MAAPYLDSTAFRLLTIAPSVHVADVESTSPGWIDAQLVHWSRWIDARLGKRYAVPFKSPFPEVVCNWLAAIVTYELYLKLGIRSTDEHFATIESRAQQAKDDIKEAADAKDGLFELPLTATSSVDGVTRGAPLAYTEASPYTWSREQRRRAEDGGELDG